MMKGLGTPFAARVAIMIAAETIGQPARPADRRDVYGIRGLAALLMRQTGASWPDISHEIYGHRNGHSTAITGAERWHDTDTAGRALDRWLPLLEDQIDASDRGDNPLA